MVLFAVLVCVNFTACGKEELPQYELVTGEKRIVKIEINNSEYGHSVWNFKYDNKGRLVEATCNKGQESKKINYVWSKNAIESSYGTYYLSDGLIRNWQNYSDVTYSPNTGRATEIGNKSSYSFYYSFTWDSDKLLRRGYYYKEENRSTIQELFSFIYNESEKTCSYSNPIVPIFLSNGFDGDFLCVIHPELVAASTTILPSHFTKEDFWISDSGRIDSETIRGTCSYKFDSDGYVTECTMNENSTNYYAYKAKYTITWE